MDLVEPSMPKMPSLLGIKEEEPGPAAAPAAVAEQGNRRVSTDEETDMLGFGDKRRFTVGSPVHRKSDDLDKQAKGSPQVALSAKQKKDIADAFNSFDVRGTGYMSAVDLRVALRALGFEAKKHDMIKLLSTYDKSNSGMLCYSDFMSIIESKLGENDTKEDLLKAFKLFDKDQTGHITFRNLQQVAEELGEDINDEELAEMIAEADWDDDGTLVQEEFIRILKKSSLY